MTTTTPTQTKTLTHDRLEDAWYDEDDNRWYSERDLKYITADAELDAYDRGYEEALNNEELNDELDSLRITAQEILDALPHGLIDQLRRDDLRLHRTLLRAGF